MTAKTLCVLDGIAYSADDLRQIIADRNEAVEQLTSRLKQSHELRCALDALELHRIPELEAKIERLEKDVARWRRERDGLGIKVGQQAEKIERLKELLEEIASQTAATWISDRIKVELNGEPK